MKHSTTDGHATTVEKSGFGGSISRRLSLVFGSVFCLVLLIGGTSLYLAGFLLYRSQELSREGKQVYSVQQIHISLHHFFSSLQRAELKETPIPTRLLQSYITGFSSLLAAYEQAGAEKRDLEQMRSLVANAIDLSERIQRDIKARPRVPRSSSNLKHLTALETTEDAVQAFTHELSGGLELHERADVLESQRKMKTAAVLNVAFILLGVFFMMGSSVYFYRAIALPLRRLAEAASEIADWNLHKELPVTSRDEIGALSHAFNTMVKKLKEHEERLKGLATIEERGRIAQELHDSIAQDLGVLHLQLIDTQRSLSSRQSAETKDLLRAMRQTVDQAHNNVRQAIFGLKIMVSKGLGLIPSLSEYLHEFSEMQKIPMDIVAHDAKSISFSPKAETQLIRIIHEALTNVFKHAQATKGSVTFERDGDFAKVTIEDDGKGFITGQVTGFHFGLQTMQERAEGAGGKLTVESIPGKGTKVIVLLPLMKEDSDETNSSPVSG